MKGKKGEREFEASGRVWGARFGGGALLMKQGESPARGWWVVTLSLRLFAERKGGREKRSIRAARRFDVDVSTFSQGSMGPGPVSLRLSRAGFRRPF